jgi:altronate dehydratase
MREDFHKKAMLINKRDNVAIALEDLKAREVIEINNRKVLLKEAIKIYHKFALDDLPTGSFVYKYGEIIGIATEEIKQGEHVHIKNVKSSRDRK